MVDKLKVLHIIDHMGLGGAQNIVKGIIEKDGDTEHLLYVLRKSSINIQSNGNIFYRKSNNKYDVFSFFELKKIIRNENVKILHCHLQKSFFMGYLLKKLCFRDILLIFHEHGQIFRNGILYPLFLNLAQKKVDMFIAVSGATNKKLLTDAKICVSKCNTLINFVDTDTFNLQSINSYDKNNERSKLGIDMIDYVIGFAARTIERKGWRELILAINELKNRNLKLIIVGNGPDREKLIHMIQKYDLEERVLYLGFIDNILTFYSCIDCFIIPSHWEPLGITALEAQSCGIPVMASNIDGLNEIVKDMETGIAFEAMNHDEIVEKINLIVENNQLSMKLISNGLENASNHSLSKYLGKLNGIYLNLADTTQFNAVW
ncbi:hypothetical protein LI82_11895 [Methanococcoides methylutens]|uniref:Glycosyl transferase family 1 domain-containing protein n=1 Tax=Methanococcoides methylutens TaxID=2226 RepID=A0A099SZS4_METMT|nr:glycosyltransferase family 4 protein [Methanococcoides methylutens]KGK98397.1 hypothetical protein LI82_11895 [Methanococcoides methylutens]